MAAKKKTKKLSPDDYHPFSQNLLVDPYQRFPSAFANQKTELKNLARFAKRKGLIGVQGPLGSGKTTLLEHYCYEKIPDSTPIVYLQLASESYAKPFTQIALAVLELCVTRNTKGKIKLHTSCKIKIADEKKRLEGELQKTVGLKLEFKPEVEIPNIAKVNSGSISLEHAIAHTMAQHDDTAALNLLRTLIQQAETPFYVVLDDFHHLRRHDGNENYFEYFVSFAEKFQRVLRHRNVTFFITLDDLVLKKRKEAEALSGGKADKYTNAELNIKGFTADGVADIIVRRLALFNYTGRKKPAFSDEAVRLIAEASRGNPRYILDLLTAAMDEAEDEGRMDIGLLDAAKAIEVETGEMPLAEVEFQILKELRENSGKMVAKDFSNAVGSKTTVYDSLNRLVERGLVKETKTETHSRAPKIYELLPVNWPRI